MLVQDVPAALAVRIVLQSLADFEVVAPTGELDAVIAELFGFAANSVKREVGPLAGKKSYWSVRFGFHAGRS
jgi:hypothetical protein